MNLFIVSTLILCIICAPAEYRYFANAQKSDSNNIFGEISNQSNSDEILSDDSKLLTSDYTPDQINDIIYRLYEVIQKSNNTQIGQNQDVAFLIDLICSNESYESVVEACDIVTELPGLTD